MSKEEKTLEEKIYNLLLEVSELESQLLLVQIELGKVIKKYCKIKMLELPSDKPQKEPKKDVSYRC